ncbi:MAG: LCP family protein, partial [Sarcina sp.]
MANIQNGSSRGPKRNKRKIIVIVILVILAGLVGGGYYYVNNTLNKLDRVQINTKNLGINKNVDSELSKFKGITNIVIFGVDEPKGTPGRSDTIMIATINQNNDTLKVTSV